MSHQETEKASALQQQVAQAEQDPNWRSYRSLLFVQTLNAFHDSVVKFVLLGVAAVTIGEAVYKNVAFGLNAFAFILFAPLAGYLSDFYSKRSVLIWMLWAQLGCIVLMALGLFSGHWLGIVPEQIADSQNKSWLAWLQLEQMPLLIATMGFFLLCIQSAFFSPAKLGILTEMLGRKRLGVANSWMMMCTMIALILGSLVGGKSFTAFLNSSQGGSGLGVDSIWLAGVFSLLPIFLFSCVALWMGYRISSTPAGNVPLRGQLWQRLLPGKQLWTLFSSSHQGQIALLKALPWFVATFVNLALIDAVREVLGTGKEADVQVGSQSAFFLSVSGLGIVLGAVLCAWVHRKRTQLGFVPLSMAVLAVLLGIFATQRISVEEIHWVSLLLLVGIGAATAFLLIPLSAYLQAIAPGKQRSEILAGSSLLDNCFVLLAVGVQLGLSLGLHLSAQEQLWVFAFLIAIASVWALLLFPREVVISLLRPIFTAIWRIRVFGQQRIPEKGGVLLTPNHVSFVDAFVLTAACPRPIRFLMEEKYYQMPWAHWFLKWMNAVPITSSKSKEAIRTVAAALQEGACVCIFPEAKLTKDGNLQLLFPGYKLIAKMSGAAIVPVRMSGLFRSLLAHSSGKMLWKKPSCLRVTVSFGKAFFAAEEAQASLQERLQTLKKLNYRLRLHTTKDTHP